MTSRIFKNNNVIDADRKLTAKTQGIHIFFPKEKYRFLI